MRQSLPRRRFLAASGTGCAAALLGPTQAASAQGETGDGNATDESTADLESLLDDLVETSLEEHGVPGATVAVVTDRTDALTKGYGVADREDGTPVDPSATAFRLGSVSKPVVATALMDLVEGGDVDPDADVSGYLDVPVGDGPGGPVTLRQLVTHRAGFESSNRGMWIQEADSLRSLEHYLEEEPQHRVRPPGRVGAYSNFGFAVAGSVLGAGADTSFAEAIDADLLSPAGMGDSSFRQPLPGRLAERHATGYSPSGTFGGPDLPLIGLRPAGAMSTTATDMARFLQLHLDGGRVDGEQVLDPGAIDAMHDRWATHHDELAGMAFGLIEEYRGDVRTLWHNGATLSFYSHLVVVPEEDLGVFVSFNSPNGSAAATDVVDGLLDELLPAESDPSSPAAPDGDPARADELGGTYRSLQQSYTWHDRVTSVLNAGTIEVRIADDGRLVTERGGTEHRWVEIEPLLFERSDGGRRLAFGERDGEIEYCFLGGSPTALGRVDGVDRLSVHGALTVATFLVALSAVVGLPGAALLRSVRSESGFSFRVDWRRRLRSRQVRATVAAVAAPVAIYGSLLLVLAHFLAAPLAVLSDPPLSFRLLFAGTVAGLVGTAATGWYAARAWVADDWRLGRRLHYTLVAATLVGLCWLLWYWNLLFPPG
jgi:CubicO group peptidase (beta-lactamase class C family)